MPKALANRLMHIEVKLSFSSWKRWAIENGVHPYVVGFLDFKRDSLMAFDPQSDHVAFPTPRSWEMVSNLLNHLGSEPEDIIGNPKIRTKFGYMTRNYINEHGWLICPELYPEKAEELKLRTIIFDDMDTPEKEREILDMFPPAPVGGTLQVRRWVRDGGKERAAALTDNELPVERRGI